MRCCPGNANLTRGSRIFRYILTVPVIVVSFVTTAVFFLPWDVGVLAAGHQTAERGNGLHEKIEAYKRFKEQYEDKDFRLNTWPVRRTSYHLGRFETVLNNVYTLSYGTVEDKLKDYNKNARRIVHSPTDAQTVADLVCEDGLYLEQYDQTGMHPETSCLNDADHYSYPIKLIFDTLDESQIRSIILINEFPTGDVDIQFIPEKEGDLGYINNVWGKLAQADERNDQTFAPTRMEPIVPDENQRVSISYIDLEDDDEPEYVLLSYCIDGSYFDADPTNNAVQVGLKYKLITRRDLEGKNAFQKSGLEARLGLWMWKKPVEILISFADHPGPDIVFNDLGIVIDDWVIDPEPDGEFDHFEFLF